MSLIYITGIETSGKTKVCNELKKRGYEAYDIDEGIAHYYDKTTGKQSEWLESAVARTVEWHEKNEYIMDRAHVERLAKQAKNKPLLLCGTTQNDEVVLDLFDKIIYLCLDENTLRQRIENRSSGELEFALHEKQAVLSWHKSSEDSYRKREAIMIDATQPVNEVTKSIEAQLS